MQYCFKKPEKQKIHHASQLIPKISRRFESLFHCIRDTNEQPASTLYLPVAFKMNHRCNHRVVKRVTQLLAFELSNFTGLQSERFRPGSRKYGRCGLQYRRNLPSMCAENEDNRTPAKLVTGSWLKKFIDENAQSELTILDVRGRVAKEGGRVKDGFQEVRYISDDRAYFEGHIPDAKFVDWRKIDISQHVSFCDDMAELGVQTDVPICIYDWGDMLFASRLWIGLIAMGCHDVSLLNGGWSVWDHVEGPVSLDTSCPLKAISQFESPFDENERPVISVSFAEMKKIVQNGDPSEKVYLLDGRSQKQFIGKERRSKRGGHIKGAMSLPYRLLLNEDGIGVRSDDELRKIFRDAGACDLVEGHASAVTYCNGGVASSLVFFAAIRCGVRLSAIRNYCGSFNEWGNHEDTLIRNPSCEE